MNWIKVSNESINPLIWAAIFLTLARLNKLTVSVRKLLISRCTV